MIQIKTLADFKRAMNVGVNVHTFHHKFGDMGSRICSISQSNSFAFATKKLELKEIEATGANINLDVDVKFLDFTEAKFILRNTEKVEGDIIRVNDIYIKAEAVNVDSWCEYPKSKDILCNGTNSVTILCEGKPILTYTFI